MATPSLELYYRTTCPFCQKVLSYMDAHDVTMTMHDITSEPGARERLIEVGGKQQVPCLFIDGKPLYESGDIVDYLQKTVVEA